MLKTLFKSLTLAILFLSLLVGVANAAVSIRLDQPKSPTNSNSFKATFTTLETEGGSVTIKCFKKGPSDGAFSQFGADVVLSGGGNKGECPSVSSFMSDSGTYQFYATSTGSSGTATSSTISVDYNTSGPGSPTNYSKDRISSCVYKIKFKTADDGGKTVKVKLFRTDSAENSASEVSSLLIGSNTEGQFDNTIPDCSKEYFYALRAYDSAGNASGTIGDSLVTSTTTTTSTTTATAATAASVGGGEAVEAIPVGATTEEGAQPTIEGEVTPAEEVLGEENPEAQKAQRAQRDRNIAIALGVAALVILGSLYLYKRYKKV